MASVIRGWNIFISIKMWPLPSVWSEGKPWRGRPRSSRPPTSSSFCWGWRARTDLAMMEKEKRHRGPGVETELMAAAVANIKANHPVNPSGCVRHEHLARYPADGYGFHLTSPVPAPVLISSFPPLVFMLDIFEMPGLARTSWSVGRSFLNNGLKRRTQ